LIDRDKERDGCAQPVSRTFPQMSQPTQTTAFPSRQSPPPILWLLITECCHPHKLKSRLLPFDSFLTEKHGDHGAEMCRDLQCSDCVVAVTVWSHNHRRVTTTPAALMGLVIHYRYEEGVYANPPPTQWAVKTHTAITFSWIQIVSFTGCNASAGTYHAIPEINQSAMVWLIVSPSIL
jgi:hypothetical protein